MPLDYRQLSSSTFMMTRQSAADIHVVTGGVVHMVFKVTRACELGMCEIAKLS